MVIQPKLSQNPLALARCQVRKRTIQDTLDPSPDPVQKRPRTSSRSAEKISGASATGLDAPQRVTDPVAFWAKEGRWPEKRCWPEETAETKITMEHLLARKKSSSSLSRKRSNSATSTTPSDQKAREEKSAPYRNAQYTLLLQTKGTYMRKSQLGITDKSTQRCQTLLDSEQPVPEESLFDDDVFEITCDNLENRNEAKVIQDISRLIVPSAEHYASRARQFKHLTESVNEGWNNSIPLTGTRPQPDYSVGFRREAFTEAQLAKLSPFIGDFIAGELSFFMATYSMYFPFLSCEVKCGAQALDIADRQNAHSMTLAVRAIVELFRGVKLEHEIHRQILAFSISHDHRSVRIYGHYPVFDGKNTTYYRHPIHTFDFTALNGRDKWTAYRFTKNVYDVWMPDHFKRICNAIDKLPLGVNFDVSALSEATRPSQSSERHYTDYDSLSMDQDSQGNSQEGVSPNTSFTEGGKRRRGQK